MNANKTQAKTDTYLIYARRSTDDANNQKNSLPYQVGETVRFAKSQGLKIAQDTIEGYCKNGIIEERHSAYKIAPISLKEGGEVTYKIERPKFQRLVDDLASGKYKGVIALCWDRLSRNDYDGSVIKHLMDALGVDVRFVQATYDRSAAGALHRDVDGMFSAHFSRDISQKTRQGLEKLRGEGRCTYVSPIGYIDHGSDRKTFDPERAPIIKRIFELYATGEWSFRQLATWARENGLTTKPMRSRRSRAEILAGKENTSEQVPRTITGKSIENILSNPFYIGKLKYKSSVIDGVHPSLIDAQLFYKVQTVLKQRGRSVHYPDKQFFLYRGFLHCICERSYSPYEQKGQTYYRSRCKEGCSNRNPNTSTNNLHNYVQDALSRIAFTEEETAEIKARSDVGLNKAVTMHDKHRADLERTFDRARDDLAYLKRERVTLLRTGAMDPETFASELQRLELELQDLGKKLEETKESAEQMLKTILEFSELIKMANLYYEHGLDQERHEILTQVFTELTLSNDQFSFLPKDGYLKLFQRHEKKKTHHATHDVVSGSAWSRTLEPLFRSIRAISASLKSLVPDRSAFECLARRPNGRAYRRKARSPTPQGHAYCLSPSSVTCHGGIQWLHEARRWLRRDSVRQCDYRVRSRPPAHRLAGLDYPVRV